MTTKTADPGRALDSLVEAFELDHRDLTRGLDGVLKAVRAGDLDEAAKLADRLDRVAGPHIEFEEEVFYPALVARFGREFVDRLFDEHDAGKQALKLLASSRETSRDSEVLREELTRQLETAHEHALSCGTLLSHLSGLEEEELERMRERLERMREEGRRWTERPDPGDE